MLSFIFSLSSHFLPSFSSYIWSSLSCVCVYFTYFVVSTWHSVPSVASLKSRAYNRAVEVCPCCDIGRWQIQLQKWWATWFRPGGKAVSISFHLFWPTDWPTPQAVFGRSLCLFYFVVVFPKYSRDGSLIFGEIICQVVTTVKHPDGEVHVVRKLGLSPRVRMNFPTIWEIYLGYGSSTQPEPSEKAFKAWSIT